MTRVQRATNRRSWYIPLRDRAGGQTQRWRRGLIVLALATVYLLFAHGCHGDEDEELYAPRKTMMGAVGRR